MNMKQHFIVKDYRLGKILCRFIHILTDLSDKDVTLQHETVWTLHNNLGMVYHTYFFPL